MPYRLNVRKFLNRHGHHAGAYIIARVQDTSRAETEDWAWADYALSISDCDRVIHLAISNRTEWDRRNTLYKIDTLIDVLGRFRAALEEEFNLARGRRSRKGRFRADGRSDGS